MKKLAVLLVLVFSVFISNSQSRSKKFDIESIKNNPEYYWGMGQVKDSHDEAMKTTWNNLYSNIANKCNPDAIYATKGDQNDYLLNIIKTFDNKIKEKIIEQVPLEDFEDDQYSYFVYMKRADFDTMCLERRNGVERLVARGYLKENDENFQIEDVLRNYYQAMMLCIAHPQGNSITVNIDDETVKAYEWLYNRIDGNDGILKSVSFVLPKENAIIENGDTKIVKLNVRSTSGIPVSNLQFDYFNGHKYIPTSVRDGEANIEVQADRTDINIRIEYEFKDDCSNPEVFKVVHTMNHDIRFKNTKKSISLDNVMNKQNEIKPVVTDKAKSYNREWRKIEDKFDIDDTEYTKIMNEVETALRNKDYASVKHLFSEEGYGMLDTLTKYGRMMIVGEQNYNFLKLGDYVICREIKMHFDFRNNISFDRDVVFRFDSSTRKITSIAFKLSDITNQDIVTKTKWSEESRLALVNFLEDYQTAYALKRHDYLESIYSDDALIIVGHVVKKTIIPDRKQFDLTEEEVRLMKYDKNTYFKNLERTFNTQEYINIEFENTKFNKMPNAEGEKADREIYGVNLLQRYRSTTYGDVGYLFLLVDLTEEHPLIHVRAWQPDEVDVDKLIGMEQLRR